MYRAIWNNVVLAESEHTVQVEGNHYFPPESLKSEYFEASATTTHCAWKGSAEYYTVTGSGQSNRDAAWVYRDPTPAAEGIRGYVAFWKGVRVEQTDSSAAASVGGDAAPVPESAHIC